MMKNKIKKSKASGNNKNRVSKKMKIIEAVSWYVANYCIRTRKTDKQ
jgi:hypothetical protein